MSKRPPPPSARPPWKAIAILSLVGMGMIGLGIATQQDWLAFPGIVPLACVPSALLVPALRISWHRRAQHGYRDMHFLGGLLSILGFNAAERDAAFAREHRIGPESHDSPPQ